MNKTVRNLLIAFVVFGIIGGIYYFNSNKSEEKPTNDEIAETEEVEETEEGMQTQDELPEEGTFVIFGTVEEVTGEDGNHQILVKNDETGGELEEVFFYTDKTPVMDLKTGEIVEEYVFEPGEKVQVFVKNNEPMMQSLPPKTNPELIAIHVEDGEYSIEVDRFSEKGRGISDRLEINLEGDYQVVDLDGVEQEDFLEQDIAVLYTVSTKSLPPIATPEKIIILK